MATGGGHLDCEAGLALPDDVGEVRDLLRRRGGGLDARLHPPFPLIHTRIWFSVRTPHTSIPSIRLASARFSAGTTTVDQPSRLAAADDVDAHRVPAGVLARQPQPGQPA
ncbi:hypothetical protein MHAEM_26237, partial [Mycolicibacterium phlei]|nr:hypothetical protein [Mycolicibacterium phlei]